VTFLDGGTTLTTVALTNGTATYSTAALLSGNHTLSVSYSGDTNYSGSAVASSGAAVVTVAPLDFSFTGSNAMSQTVIPGAAASFTYAVTPTYGTYPATVSFTVTGLPPGATYTLTPSTLAANAGAQTVTLNVQTADIAAKNTSPLGGGMTPLILALLMLPMAGARRLRNSRQKLTRYIALLLLVAGLAGAAGLTGCGGGNGFLGQSPKNYTVTVTATAGTVQHTFTSTLNLQ
jgi:hypothetical protein